MTSHMLRLKGMCHNICRFCLFMNEHVSIKILGTRLGDGTVMKMFAVKMES